ncbi:MAG: hypothetical protein K8S94_13710 [Planctomycetia bacterium]|nr:hypothetical protein [Planctomycetia bacterium]
MGTGLFDSPSRTSHPGATARDNGEAYRALSGAAIAAAAVALVSPLVFFGWWFAAVPAIGIALALVALRDIATRPLDLTGTPLATGALAVSAIVLVGGLVSLAREYAAELPEGFERLSYAMLQPAEGDPPTSVPDAARALDGHNVLLKGYIYPGKEQHGLVQFLLVRDQGDCCFGGNPKITDRVLVQLAEPRGIDFTPRLTKVAGRFRVQPMGTADLAGGVLYHLDNAFVR